MDNAVALLSMGGVLSDACDRAQRVDLLHALLEAADRYSGAASYRLPLVSAFMQLAHNILLGMRFAGCSDLSSSGVRSAQLASAVGPIMRMLSRGTLVRLMAHHDPHLAFCAMSMFSSFVSLSDVLADRALQLPQLLQQLLRIMRRSGHSAVPGAAVNALHTIICGEPTLKHSTAGVTKRAAAMYAACPDVVPTLAGVLAAHGTPEPGSPPGSIAMIAQTAAMALGLIVSSTPTAALALRKLARGSGGGGGDSSSGNRRGGGDSGGEAQERGLLTALGPLLVRGDFTRSLTETGGVQSTYHTAGEVWMPRVGAAMHIASALCQGATPAELRRLIAVPGLMPMVDMTMCDEEGGLLRSALELESAHIAWALAGTDDAECQRVLKAAIPWARCAELVGEQRGMQKRTSVRTVGEQEEGRGQQQEQQQHVGQDRRGECGTSGCVDSSRGSVDKGVPGEGAQACSTCGRRRGAGVQLRKCSGCYRRAYCSADW